MSGPVFVRDAEGTPLMPMAAANARRLLRDGKVVRHPHHAFTIVQLTKSLPDPTLHRVMLTLTVHLHTAELLVIAEHRRGTLPVLRVIVDLRSDLSWRTRRRAAHRRRRRLRGRYRAPRRYGQPFAVRRPSIAKARLTRRARARPVRQRSSSSAHLPPIMQWRAQAIERVINILRGLVPISHIVLVAPPQAPVDAAQAGIDIRDVLLSIYGWRDADGQRHAACAYCGATQRKLVIDHVLPKSRGGTDALHNVVLACGQCNTQKGEQTPAEAGMVVDATLLINDHTRVQRTRPYVRQTLRRLHTRLVELGFVVNWSYNPSSASSEHQMRAKRQGETGAAPLFIAKAIPRPRKQRFTGRNYPLRTPLQPGYVRVRQTVKRYVRVNAGLAVWFRNNRIDTHVVPTGQSVPEGARIIRIGMLCEGRRADALVRGVVSAVHTTGRLTLLVPVTVTSTLITWQSTVISPRQHLRLISSDHVVFFSM